jgi:hypothetical protein
MFVLPYSLTRGVHRASWARGRGRRPRHGSRCASRDGDAMFSYVPSGRWPRVIASHAGHRTGVDDIRRLGSDGSLAGSRIGRRT